MSANELIFLNGTTFFKTVHLSFKSTEITKLYYLITKYRLFETDISILVTVMTKLVRIDYENEKVQLFYKRYISFQNSLTLL
jgi:hypothetical protein